MIAKYCKYILRFKQPAGTSRGVLTEKETYFIKVYEPSTPEVFGIGECALFRGLSADDVPDYEQRLAALCQAISRDEQSDLTQFPSMLFGLETAVYDLSSGGRRTPFPSAFTDGQGEIPINGLVWMGSRDEMLARIDDKLKAGFTTIKIKVGAIDFESELDLLRHIRKVFPAEAITIRLDANGGFSHDVALERLDALARYDIHSIEQPIKAGQWDEMAELCLNSPIPIALDEELIGIADTAERCRMLDTIKPQFVVLKPSLVGGFLQTQQWMMLAAQRGIGGWITSALESNIGLNAIAQWTAAMGADMPQGLGTGALFTNNFDCPLRQIGELLCYDPTAHWQLPELDWR